MRERITRQKFERQRGAQPARRFGIWAVRVEVGAELGGSGRFLCELEKVIYFRVTTSELLTFAAQSSYEHRADDCGFAHGEHCENTKSYFVVARASANGADVPLQFTDYATVASSVREGVRVRKDRKHAA
jgi:hypothetical protein